MAYVYRHIRLDKNIPFYIGIGSGKKYERAFRKSGRNAYWHNVVNKSGGYEVEIMLDDISWDEACKKEIEFIKLYGKVKNGGYLINLTDGGDGILGLKPRLGTKWSAETREKNRIAHTGLTHTEEEKKRISIRMKGNKRGEGRIVSDETRKKIGLGNKGKIHSEEQTKKLADFNRGKKHSEETRLKRSLALKGRIMSPETRLKISNTHKGMKQSLESRLKISQSRMGKKYPKIKVVG